jgi:F420-dependent oxidoreductase-like protein
MRLSVCLDPGRPWDELLKLAQQADAAGLDGIWVCDHFVSERGPMLEGWTCLAALATATRRVRIGSLVAGNTYRHPAVVANMAATIDHASSGRFVLGIGAGWQVDEHVAYGIPMPPTAERLDRLEEACELITSLLREQRTTFAGRFYRTINAPCEPKPLQSPLPLLVGGGGERRTMRIAARFAQEWHAWTSPDEFRHKSAVLDAHCEAVGRDPSCIRRVTGCSPPGYGADDTDWEEALTVVGSYRDAGADEFVVRDDAGASLGAAIDHLRALAEAVQRGLR